MYDEPTANIMFTRMVLSNGSFNSNCCLTDRSQLYAGRHSADCTFFVSIIGQISVYANRNLRMATSVDCVHDDAACSVPYQAQLQMIY